MSNACALHFYEGTLYYIAINRFLKLSLIPFQQREIESLFMFTKAFCFKFKICKKINKSKIKYIFEYKMLNFHILKKINFFNIIFSSLQMHVSVTNRFRVTDSTCRTY